jgi:hypothetical protein
MFGKGEPELSIPKLKAESGDGTDVSEADVFVSVFWVRVIAGLRNGETKLSVSFLSLDDIGRSRLVFWGCGKVRSDVVSWPIIVLRRQEWSVVPLNRAFFGCSFSNDFSLV